MPSSTRSNSPRTRMRPKVAREAPSRLTCTALTPSVLQARAVSGDEVVAVGLDLELAAARADALDHLEEVRVQHRLAAGERQVGDLAIHQLVEDGEDLVAVELVRERLARPALLDAVQAGEVALVGDLPGDVQRRGEILRLGGRRSRSRHHPSTRPRWRRSARKAATSRSIAPPWSAKRSFSRAAIVASSPLRDLAHHGRGRRVEGEDLFGARLEQHAAELLLAELDVLGQAHAIAPSNSTGTGLR